jgi:DNA primase
VSNFLNFKELRQRLSFRDIFMHYRVEITEKAGGQAMGFCPLPNHPVSLEPRRSPSFSANLERGIWQCFSCGGSGNLIEFSVLMEGLDPASGVDFRQTALKLADRFNIKTGKPQGFAKGATPATKHSPEQAAPVSLPAATSKSLSDEVGDAPALPILLPTNPSLPVVINQVLEFELKDLDTAHPYLLGRGFTLETITHFGLGVCHRGLMKDRVAIPLHDTQGQRIGYAGRCINDAAIDAQNPRYKFPGARETKGVRHEFHKNEFLYRGYTLTKPVNDLIVVEGFTALWWLWQHGFHSVVALMGSACSDAQAALLVQHVKAKGRIWFFADGDAAGVRCAKDTLALLAPARSMRLILVDGKQPTDFNENELHKLLPA